MRSGDFAHADWIARRRQKYILPQFLLKARRGRHRARDVAEKKWRNAADYFA